MTDTLAIGVIVASGVSLGAIALYRGRVNRRLKRQLRETEA